MKSHPLNPKIFLLGVKNGAMNIKHPRLHCELRWLPTGNLNYEVLIFLEQYLNSKTVFLILIKIEYLCDIFDFLNNVNLTLYSCHCIQSAGEGRVCNKKVTLSSRRVKTKSNKLLQS